MRLCPCRPAAAAAVTLSSCPRLQQAGPRIPPPFPSHARRAMYACFTLLVL